ncbi:head-tail connector protein [Staphylococcus sp. LCT-H4]|uniref:head-tail connector protein n=1 Tax=Staphylococcus sp. LCT-H4 TaxID=1914308 RepID=UPI0008F4A6B2|nr:head-tail connector protein [Staphylococcus sp. LCT-H4]OIJ29045.1 hypothetical protein BK821_12395 [Staphylococcus sp. LCT-H4]
MELETLKKHLKVSHSMEDDVIKDYYDWAEAEIKDSVSTSPTRNESFFKDNKIYERACVMLTAHYFEQRIAYSDVQLSEVNDSVTSAIQKLRGSYYES